MSITRSVKPTKRFKVGESSFDTGMEEICSVIRSLDADGADNAEAIQCVAAMLNELNEARANLLAIRARAFLKQARFDQAITDASKAIDACPTSGQFYLLTSGLHIANGKPKLAIDILENGLRSTPPSDWPALYDGREAAKRLLEAKVDFVSIMPPEITERIFTWLPRKHAPYSNNVLRFSPTTISKSWRAAALDCSSLWKVAQRTEFGETNVTFRIFPSICNHVEEVDIHHLSNRQSQELGSLASRNMLQSLTKVSLGDSVRLSILLHLISVIGKQLTELKLGSILYDESQDDTFPLDTVLETCTNLKALTLLQYGERTRYQPSQLPSLGMLNIEMLSIGDPYEYADDGDSNDFLYQLIPRCRQLRFLNLPCYPTNFFELVTEHCLQLEEVAILDTHECNEDIWEKKYKKQRQPTTGLKRLQYGHTRNEYSGERPSELRDLVPLWIRAKDTLQKIELELVDDDISSMEQDDWDSLFSHDYSHLKSLLISRREDNSVSADQTLKLVQLCPNLEHVQISIKTVLPNDFFATFTGLRYLRRLDMYGLDISCGEFQQYLEYLSAIDHKSYLKEILIFNCEGVTDQDLFALGGVSSLEQIKISGKCHMLSSSGIATFLQRLKSNASLQFLEISNPVNFTSSCLSEMEELVELNKTGNRYLFRKHKQSGTGPHNARYNTAMFDRRKDSPYF